MSEAHIQNYQDALSYIYQSIPFTDKFPGSLGLNRTRELLRKLGNPDEQMKLIHVAGTSGKGSTSYIISELLQSQGFEVGLQVSPHLIDIRERMQINGKLIDEGAFVRNLNTLIPAIHTLNNKYDSNVTYFELLVALGIQIFADSSVDYAVIETGLGGTFDGTNAINPERKLCVITQIGFDHTKVLGETLPQITAQKSGIIHKGNTAVAIDQESEVIETIKKRVIEVSAKLIIAKKKPHVLLPRKLGMHGDFQIENTTLALTVLEELSKRDHFGIDTNRARHTLSQAHFPGRFEIRNYLSEPGIEKQIIVDGAHNPQKMSRLIANVEPLLGNHKKADFLIAMRRGKDLIPMLEEILPIAEHIFITSFFSKKQDLRRLSYPPEEIAEGLVKLGHNNYSTITDANSALEETLKNTHGEDNTQNPLVITGSLYLLGEIYTRILEKTTQPHN